MNAERSEAYGRVMRTLADVGPSKLQPFEQDLIREAADAALFASADDGGATALAAVTEVHELAARLVEADRWLIAAVVRLVADVEACGPRVRVGGVEQRELVTQVA